MWCEAGLRCMSNVRPKELITMLLLRRSNSLRLRLGLARHLIRMSIHRHRALQVYKVRDEQERVKKRKRWRICGCVQGEDGKRDKDASWIYLTCSLAWANEEET